MQPLETLPADIRLVEDHIGRQSARQLDLLDMVKLVIGHPLPQLRQARFVYIDLLPVAVDLGNKLFDFFTQAENLLHRGSFRVLLPWLKGV